MSSFFLIFVALVFITLTGAYNSYHAYIVFIVCVLVLRPFSFPYRGIRLSTLNYLHAKKKEKKINVKNESCTIMHVKL